MTARKRDARKRLKRIAFWALVAVGPAGSSVCFSQSAAPPVSDPRARAVIQSAVNAELAADKADHSQWCYHEHVVNDSVDQVYQAVETPEGTVRRIIAKHGKPLDDANTAAETRRLATVIRDQQDRSRQKKNGEHDDDQARQMTASFPDAYIWTIKSESKDATELAFRPNPAFRPPNNEARVMGMMAGQVVVVKGDNRIRTLRGALTEDVKFGYGLFGKLEKGGTFDIERREVAPHHWQITESRVHIGGHALLFKTIGQQEDDIKTDWKPSTAPTLEAAAQQVGVQVATR